jgi:hypothetical protein
MGQEVQDGNVSFRGGQNSGVLPDRIGEDQYARGVNVTTKDGGLGPRPGFVHQQLSVVTEGGITQDSGMFVSYSEIFRSGKFQGSAPYVSDNGQFILAVISGVIFQIDPIANTAEVLEIEDPTITTTPVSDEFLPETERLDQYVARHPISEAGRFMTIFDYPALPVIIEGSEARRSDPDATDVDGDPEPEVPASVMGAYNQNRLFVASQVHEFTGGDPVGSLTAPNAPITFKEIFNPASAFIGQVFSLGSTNTNNPITALGFIQVPDTSTGIGPLFIATKDSVYTFRTDLPRTSWEQVQFGSLILFNSGIAGFKAFTNLNSDLIYMGGDGQIRSLHTGRQEQSRWSNNPIDRELGDYVRFDDKALNQLSVVSSFRNRVFVAVNPYSMFARDVCGKPVVDYAFRGIAVMELDNVSALLRAANPVWAGIWTGIDPTDILVLDNELYIFAKDANGKNDFYKLDESRSSDVYAGVSRTIVSRFYTREYSFESGSMLKEEKSTKLLLTDLSGQVEVSVDRKSESAANFSLWGEWKHKAQVGTKDAACGELKELSPHSLRELTFGEPKQHDCNEVTNDDLRYFRKQQYRVTISADTWKLIDFLAMAEMQPDANRTAGVCDSKEVLIEKNCKDVSDWGLYDIESEAGCLI